MNVKESRNNHDFHSKLFLFSCRHENIIIHSNDRCRSNTVARVYGLYVLEPEFCGLSEYGLRNSVSVFVREW